jgi:hypothetical protein
LHQVETLPQALAATVSEPGVDVFAVDHHRVVFPEQSWWPLTPTAVAASAWSGNRSGRASNPSPNDQRRVICMAEGIGDQQAGRRSPRRST